MGSAAATAAMMMMLMTVMTLTVMPTAVHFASAADTQYTEFCQNEEFGASCSGSSSVIVMRSARYGRMSVGRCVRRDYGFVGCGSDVMPITDQLCSGRRNCTVRVPNSWFDDAAQRARCPEDFKNYLEVAYDCLDVISPPRGGCRSPASRPGVNPLPTTTRPEGVIASVVTSETDCGSHVAPWRLRALPGQHFNVTLVDFAHALSSTGSSSAAERRACYAYAVFKEAATSYTLCGGQSASRETTAYVSTTEKLTISVISRNDAEFPRNFLLKYNVLGCGTPAAPPGGWVRRHGDRLTLGCNFTAGMSWSLTCVDSQWVGDTYNCTLPENSLGLTAQGIVNRLSFELAFAAVVFIAFVIAGVILCIGVVCIRRYSQRTAMKARRCVELHAPSAYGHAAYDFASGHSVLSSSDYIFRDGPVRAAALGGPSLPPDLYKSPSSNDYAYIQESGCRHASGDISRPGSTTPYSTLERTGSERGSQQQHQQQQLQHPHQRTPPLPPGVQWAREKPTPPGDCFDPASRRLLLFHKRTIDDSAVPVTFA